MKSYSKYCVEQNTAFVALPEQAHELGCELAHEHALVDANQVPNALHAHAADALPSDAVGRHVGHGGGHQASNERSLTARGDVSNLQNELQARADLAIPDLPPIVERASNKPLPAALAPGRSDQPHLSVSQLPV